MKYAVNKIFTTKLEDVFKICEKLDIEELFFFGSSINGKFVNGKSDLDILVDTTSKNKKNVVRLGIELRELFKCPVDVFHKKWANHRELMEYLNSNKILIYKKNITNKV